MKKKSTFSLSKNQINLKFIIFFYVSTPVSSFSFLILILFCNGLHYPIVLTQHYVHLEITRKMRHLWRTLPLIGRCRWSFINLFSLLNSEYYSFDRKETLKTWVPPPRLCGWRGSPHPRAFVFLHVPGSRLGSAKESIHRISNRNSCETFLWLFMYIHIFLFHNYFGFKK